MRWGGVTLGKLGKANESALRALGETGQRVGKEGIFLEEAIENEVGESKV